jgi:hypothetical protein
MSTTMTPELARDATESIYASAAKGLDEAGATEKSAYSVIAMQQFAENGHVALKAVEMSLKLRGKLVEKHQHEVSGTFNVMAAVVDALAKLKAENDPSGSGR